MTRYASMFSQLGDKGEIAFIPFTLIGDPDLKSSMAIVESLIQAGADALELGIPFSDPVADGPTIQSAGVRARNAGVTPEDCISFIKQVRMGYPEIPIGLLLYVNLVFKPGISEFYEKLSNCGADSILIADVPVCESAPFLKAAAKHGLHQVFIAPPNASPQRLKEISLSGSGYTYVVTRAGVTGADQLMSESNRGIIDTLKQLGAPPAVLGFGISEPEHIRKAKAMGAAGAISGSAIVSIIEKNLGDLVETRKQLFDFVKGMKQAS